MAIVIGTDGNDRYNDPAYPGNVELKGTNLADQIHGLAGDDLDLASYQNSSAGVLVDLGIPSAGGGDAADDTLHEIEGVVGSAFADALRGSEGANVLRGGGGADMVDGHWGD